MIRRRNGEQDTEKEIGRDVRRILNGKGVARRVTDEPDTDPAYADDVYEADPGYADDIYGADPAYADDVFGADPAYEDDAYDDGSRDDSYDDSGEDEEYGRGSLRSGRGRAGGRGPYLFISCVFFVLFLLLAGQIVYFNLKLKDSILNSPYNRRQSALADYVVRGEIRSRDGAVLAKTETDSEGNETRVYPYGSEYAHTVGFATHGKSGIEATANFQLLTSHANIIDEIINDFRGRKNPGDTVISTLDSRLQDAAYSALGDYQGAVIVMNPKTGAILAMTAKPDFDPNRLAEEWDAMISDSSSSQLLNRATQGLYPPGSTFKIVTSLAYFRKYHTFTNFSYNCTGAFEIGNTTVHCFEGAEHGEEDYISAFAHSCNTAFSQIGLDLGASRLTSTAESLLFNEEIYSPLNTSKSRWSLTGESGGQELVQTAFGQGKTLVTPYHMALIMSAIANDGAVMKPYLIDRVENGAGRVIKKTRPRRYTQLITGSEAAALKTLLAAVVTDGSARALSDRGYEVAGKTGSAEYTKADGSLGTHSWFVGYSGGNDPDLVICVLAENGGAGSATAVPIAGEILDRYYAGIHAEDAMKAETETEEQETASESAEEEEWIGERNADEEDGGEDFPEEDAGGDFSGGTSGEDFSGGDASGDDFTEDEGGDEAFVPEDDWFEETPVAEEGWEEELGGSGEEWTGTADADGDGWVSDFAEDFTGSPDTGGELQEEELQ